MACGDPDWYVRQQNQVIFDNFELPWITQQRQMESRPGWGKYWPDLYLNQYLSFSVRPIYCWQSSVLPGSTPIEIIQDVTEWLMLNIDNVWEGPIGYMGYWKFRFTEETDRMAFKLYTT